MEASQSKIEGGRVRLLGWKSSSLADTPTKSRVYLSSAKRNRLDGAHRDDESEEDGGYGKGPESDGGKKRYS